MRTSANFMTHFPAHAFPAVPSNEAIDGAIVRCYGKNINEPRQCGSTSNTALVSAAYAAKSDESIVVSVCLLCVCVCAIVEGGTKPAPGTNSHAVTTPFSPQACLCNPSPNNEDDSSLYHFITSSPDASAQ